MCIKCYRTKLQKIRYYIWKGMIIKMQDLEENIKKLKDADVRLKSLGDSL